MRLGDVERGETLPTRLLIGLISTMTGMRLPDAARVAFYHKAFFSGPMSEWTQAAMRGPSEWSVGERELMAALVAKWNRCRFCLGAHGAVARKACDPDLVDAALRDFHTAPVLPALKATLEFIERLTLEPADVSPRDAEKVLSAGVTRDALNDAIAVAAIFNTICRYADALDFAVPSGPHFARAATMLLKRGYK